MIKDSWNIYIFAQKNVYQTVFFYKVYFYCKYFFIVV